MTVKVRVVWDEDGLGRLAHEVWTALVRIAPATVADLVGETRRAPATVRKMLRELERYRLAASNGHQWTYLERDLDELAAELGVGHVRDRRRQRYQADREGYQGHLEQEQQRREQRQRERERAELNLNSQVERPKRRPMRRDSGPLTSAEASVVDIVAAQPKADVVAVSQVAERQQMAAAEGRRGRWSQAASLPKRRAVCAGPERHEQWFSETTLGHLSCSACGAPFRWAA